MTVVKVLDHGYVRLIDVMGSDISVVNSARVSFNKRSNFNDNGSVKEKDSRLIRFLWENNHTAPFRHASLTFEINAPLMIARQHWKHHVASTYVDDQNGWNEMSKRYVTETPEFYVPAPEEWRSAPSNLKQGSGKPIEAYGDQNDDSRNWMEIPEYGEDFTDLLNVYVKQGVELYEKAMENGVCAEQARLFLPAYGMYIKYYWTVSLHGLMNFLSLRLPKDAQKEIVEYAKAVGKLSAEKFPVSLALLNDNG